ncbi:hypothetical protein CRM22_007385 [Opisthorchis felineus]|uniref:Uncharacterized protein n=1 Tax=Opisthorchis felineus TaxID=147828 RepID=A0A4S2LGK0_OPIFE|nr:hypothetical protein CRM22_007385 [Opisthorchis felineus]
MFTDWWPMRVRNQMEDYENILVKFVGNQLHSRRIYKFICVCIQKKNRLYAAYVAGRLAHQVIFTAIVERCILRLKKLTKVIFLRLAIVEQTIVHASVTRLICTDLDHVHK